MKNIKDLIPANLTHPGEMLADELKARNILQKELAEIMGLLPNHINMIIRGKRPIGVKMAYLLSAALNMDPEIWLNLQRNYELDKLKKDRAFQNKLHDVKVRRKNKSL